MEKVWNFNLKRTVYSKGIIFSNSFFFKIHNISKSRGFQKTVYKNFENAKEIKKNSYS